MNISFLIHTLANLAYMIFLIQHFKSVGFRLLSYIAGSIHIHHYFNLYIFTLVFIYQNRFFCFLYTHFSKPCSYDNSDVTLEVLIILCEGSDWYWMLQALYIYITLSPLCLSFLSFYITICCFIRFKVSRCLIRPHQS